MLKLSKFLHSGICGHEAYQLHWDPFRGQQKHFIKSSKRSAFLYLQIGLQHGRAAKEEIARGLRFYEILFQKTAKLSWSQVCDTAAQFEPFLSSEWSDYCTEMKGTQTIIHFFVTYYSAFTHGIEPSKVSKLPCCSGRAYGMHDNTASSIEYTLGTLGGRTCINSLEKSSKY